MRNGKVKVEVGQSYTWPKDEMVLESRHNVLLVAPPDMGDIYQFKAGFKSYAALVKEPFMRQQFDDLFSLLVSKDTVCCYTRWRPMAKSANLFDISMFAGMEYKRLVIPHPTSLEAADDSAGTRLFPIASNDREIKFSYLHRFS